MLGTAGPAQHLRDAGAVVDEQRLLDEPLVDALGHPPLAASAFDDVGIAGKQRRDEAAGLLRALSFAHTPGRARRLPAAPLAVKLDRTNATLGTDQFNAIRQ